MADYQQCNIKSPHENHPWSEVNMNSAAFHYCQGVVWKNPEVYEKLKELIAEELKKNDNNYWQGGLNPATRITEAIWKDMVGFIQPEDMPYTVTLGGDSIPDREYFVGAGRVMLIPPTPEERMADALEKMAWSLEALTTTIQLKEN